MHRATFLFSGQGSQYFQMGAELYKHHSVFRDIMDIGDEVCIRRMGRSVVNEIYGSSISDEFNDFALTHPALVMLQFALFKALTNEEVEPTSLWGTSVGEYVSFIAANVWSYEDALEAVIRQTQIVAARCTPGGMIAVLPSQPAFQVPSDIPVEIAGVNYQDSIVYSGEARAITTLSDYLSKHRINYVRLPVTYGFHSSSIDPAERDFREFCASLPPLNEPTKIIISSQLGRPLTHQDIGYSHLWNAVRQPMSFLETLLSPSLDKTHIFIDCGPSSTYCAAIRRSGVDVLAIPILSPFQKGLASANIKTAKGLLVR